MAGAPRWKVFDADKRYQASVKEPEAGAALLGSIYPGGTLRLGHSHVVFTDGVDGDAVDSWDVVARAALAALEQVGW